MGPTQEQAETASDQMDFNDNPLKCPLDLSRMDLGSELSTLINIKSGDTRVNKENKSFNNDRKNKFDRLKLEGPGDRYHFVLSRKDQVQFQRGGDKGGQAAGPPLAPLSAWPPTDLLATQTTTWGGGCKSIFRKTFPCFACYYALL